MNENFFSFVLWGLSVEMWRDGFWGKALAVFYNFTMIALLFLCFSLGWSLFHPPPPDPPGTTYTYEDTIMCQNTVGANGSVGIVCFPTYNKVPHYPEGYQR